MAPSDAAGADDVAAALAAMDGFTDEGAGDAGVGELEALGAVVELARGSGVEVAELEATAPWVVGLAAAMLGSGAELVADDAPAGAGLVVLAVIDPNASALTVALDAMAMGAGSAFDEAPLLAVFGGDFAVFVATGSAAAAVFCDRASRVATVGLEGLGCGSAAPRASATRAGASAPFGVAATDPDGWFDSTAGDAVVAAGLAACGVGRSLVLRSRITAPPMTVAAITPIPIPK